MARGACASHFTSIKLHWAVESTIGIGHLPLASGGLCVLWQSQKFTFQTLVYLTSHENITLHINKVIVM